MSLNDIHSLSHTKWNCKYHIVFAPKYRRKVFYQEKRAEVGKILRQLCEWKGVNIIQAEVCPDHIHMLVEIPPKIAVSSFMGYLKGKESTSLRTLSRAALTLFGALLLLYLCSVPVHYAIITSFNARVGEGNPWDTTMTLAYIGVRAAWMVLALAVGALVRKKTAAALEDHGPARKKALTVSLAVFALCALLDMLQVLDTAYFVIAYSIGVYDWGQLLPAALWEALFYGDFGWMLLMGWVALLLPAMERKKLALAQTGLVAVMVFVRFML